MTHHVFVIDALTGAVLAERVWLGVVPVDGDYLEIPAYARRVLVTGRSIAFAPPRLGDRFSPVAHVVTLFVADVDAANDPDPARRHL